ncbi:MAG: hypothetical protein A2W76_11185 [Gammaproteobacteria bacterium RIFCSPLOWO2_12_47_11]|nr:MAG: hypothetical protein A2W76_11185 [Gammaproteobacteria bacterium RIFCSPLOWO2_12_47_11]
MRRHAGGDEKFLLDKFSEADLHTWRTVAAGMEAYQVQLSYHLAGLRQLHNDEICGALRSIAGISQDLQEWCRIVDYQYSMDTLSARGSLIKGGRFNIGADLVRNSQPTFPALYCAENYKTAYMEKFGALEKDDNSEFSGHEFALRKLTSFTSVQLIGTVKNIFDLRRESNLKAFIKIIEKFELSKELKELAKMLGIRIPLVTNTQQLMQTFLRPIGVIPPYNLAFLPIHRFLAVCFVIPSLKVFSTHLQKEIIIVLRYFPKISKEAIHM